MGCGISRPAMDDSAATQPGLLPIRRRIEEIRRNRLRSHKRSKSELSSRELLGQEDEHEEESIQGDGRKSVSCRLESIAEVQRVPFTEKMKRNDSVVDDDQHGEIEEEEEEEEEGNRLGDGPGSPSFREYVHSSDDSEEITKEGSKSDEEEEKRQRRDSIASSEESVKVLVGKKEHKGSRLRRVLPKGGQAAVKNLLNVKGCYCSNPLTHTNPRLAPVPSS